MRIHLPAQSSYGCPAGVRIRRSARQRRGTEVFGRKLGADTGGDVMCAHSRFGGATAPDWCCSAHLKGQISDRSLRGCRPRSASTSDPFSNIAQVKVDQQELPFRQWGGARKGSGRKRRSARPNVPHRLRQGFRKAALHVTLRMRREVWNLRTHRCLRALRSAFAHGCERFGFRLVEFSVQRNHVHCIVEAPDAETLRPRDEGARGADGARPQQADAPHRPRVRRSLPRAPSDLAAAGRERSPVRARELEHSRRAKRGASSVWR